MAKIVGYTELKPDAFEARQNLPSELTLSTMYEPSEEEKEILRVLRNSTNIVQCIALRDIDCFCAYKELTAEEYDIAYKEGFVLNSVDENGRCMYVRKDTLI